MPIDGTEGGLSWDSPTLKKGLKVKGRVTSVKDFGVFIQIEDSSVRTLPLACRRPLGLFGVCYLARQLSTGSGHRAGFC